MKLLVLPAAYLPDQHHGQTDRYTDSQLALNNQMMLMLTENVILNCLFNFLNTQLTH